MNKWINVKDKLPYPNDKCVVILSDRSLGISVLGSNPEGTITWWTLDMDVTHWMPLPDFPKDNEKS